MGRYIVCGKKRLLGTTDIHGSKNAALPILCATILNKGNNIIHNCPKITDVFHTCEILEKAGCIIKWDGSTVSVDSSEMNNVDVDINLASKMRSSVLFMGPLCARFKKCSIAKPGGCRIGIRPIDMHIEAFEKMGIEIKCDRDMIYTDATIIKPCEITLKIPSVGATENILLASFYAEGETVIRNAAIEPEIIALCEYLDLIGAKTSINGNTISIKGADKLYDGEITVIPDRIEAGTIMSACAICGGEIFLRKAKAEHMQSVIDVFRSMGMTISSCERGILFKSDGTGIDAQNIRTGYYPEFPTDMQPQIMSVLSVADGESVITEEIFESRFSNAFELGKMGANIEIDGKRAIIKGVKELKPYKVDAYDLRAGAGLIVAALSCKGVSVINSAEYVMRGYENIEKNLSELGADIAFLNR